VVGLGALPCIGESVKEERPSLTLSLKLNNFMEEAL